MRKHATRILAGHLNEKAIDIQKDTAVAMHIMHDAERYWTWQWILEKLQSLFKIQARLSHHISLGHLLPEEYQIALLSLKALLMDIVRRRVCYIGQELPDRPGFCSA